MIRTGWENELGILKTRVIADHYGIYRDLFDNAFFYAGIPLHISYDFDDESVTPVYTGNRILPSEVWRFTSTHTLSSDGINSPI